MRKQFWIILLVNLAFYLATIAFWVILDQLLWLKIIFTMISSAITILLLWIQRDKLIRYAKGELFAHQFNTLVRTVSIFGILALINFLLVKHPIVYDLSKYGNSSLTNQSREILHQVKEQLDAKIFATKQQQGPIIALLELYQYIKPDINIEIIDVDMRPDLVKQYGITKDGTVILHYKGRQEKLEKLSELEIDNALIRLTRKKRPLLCWSTGHQEVDLRSKGKGGASYLYDQLTKSAFDVKVVNLKINDLNKCDIFVLLEPKNILQTVEVKKIKQFIEHKGKVLLGLGPSLNREAFVDVRHLFANYGVILKNNFVVDRLSYVSGSQGLIPLLKKLDKTSSITKHLKGSLFFPLVSSVVVETSKQLGKINYLAKTSDFPASWAENSLSEMLTKKITFNDGVDVRGPITVALSWKESSAQHSLLRFIVLGNGSFIQNQYKGFSDNFSFFNHALVWLSGDDQLTSFVDISLDHSKIILSKPLMQVLFFFSLILMPLILSALSIWIYLFRKR